MKASDEALLFYTYDHDLDSETRERLVAAIGRFPGCEAAGRLATAMALALVPGGLRRLGLIKTRSPALPVVLATIGFLTGGSLGNSYALKIGTRELCDHPHGLRAFQMMAQHKPEIGARYFRASSQDPRLIMPDPAIIDWSRAPTFPHNLAKSVDDRAVLSYVKDQAVDLGYKRPLRPKPSVSVSLFGKVTSLNGAQPSTDRDEVPETKPPSLNDVTDDFSESEKKW